MMSVQEQGQWLSVEKSVAHVFFFSKEKHTPFPFQAPVLIS